MSSLDYLLLLSSDQRPKYIEDIYSLLALPEGASYRFRYEIRYLPPDVAEALGEGFLGSVSALVAFKGKFDKSECIVPVRWIRVFRVRRVLDFVVFYFTVDSYPVVNSQLRPATADRLAAASSEYLEQIPVGLRGLPVLTSRLGFVEPRSKRSSDAWLEIVKLLSLHEQFSGLHFLRVVNFSSNIGVEMRDETARILVAEDSYSNVELEFYADRFESIETLSLTSDEGIVRFASGKTHQLRSRYDLVSSLLHFQSVRGRTETELHFEVRNDESKRAFNFSVPLEVRGSRLRLIGRMLVPTLGAVLVAARGFMPANADIRFVALVVLLGALLIGFSVANRK